MDLEARRGWVHRGGGATPGVVGPWANRGLLAIVDGYEVLCPHPVRWDFPNSDSRLHPRVVQTWTSIVGSIRDAVLLGTRRVEAGNSAPLHTCVPVSSWYVEGADCQADAGCLLEPLQPIFLNRRIGKLSYTDQLYFLWSSACSDCF
jgi:hypothetical protein